MKSIQNFIDYMDCLLEKKIWEIFVPWNKEYQRNENLEEFSISLRLQKGNLVKDWVQTNFEYKINFVTSFLIIDYFSLFYLVGLVIHILLGQEVIMKESLETLSDMDSGSFFLSIRRSKTYPFEKSLLR